MSKHWGLKDAERLGNLLKYLMTLPLGKGLMVTIEKSSKTPSQRAYWHNLIRSIATYEGIPEDEMKDAIKLAFLGKVAKKDINGVEHMVLPSTESLRKEDYSLLIEKTLIFMSERGIPEMGAKYYGLERQ